MVDGDKADHPGTLNHAVLGDILTLAAAALYAVYTVLIKVMMPEDSESDMMAFFGYLGAVNAVAFAPVLLIMQVAGSFDVLSISKATLSVALLKGVCAVPQSELVSFCAQYACWYAAHSYCVCGVLFVCFKAGSLQGYLTTL